MGDNWELHYALLAHRFGKTLAEIDEQPWPEVGRAINLVRGRGLIDGR